MLRSSAALLREGLGRAGPCPFPSRRGSRRVEGGVPPNAVEEAARPAFGRPPPQDCHRSTHRVTPWCAHSTPLRAPVVHFHHQRPPAFPSVPSPRFSVLPP